MENSGANVSEFDQRQYRRMLYMLDRLESGDFSMDLVTNLYALTDVLEEPDTQWNKTFTAYLGRLNDIIAIAVVELEQEGEAGLRKPLSFDDAAVKSLMTRAARLKRLVQAKIVGASEAVEGDG